MKTSKGEEHRRMMLDQLRDNYKYCNEADKEKGIQQLLNTYSVKEVAYITRKTDEPD